VTNAGGASFDLGFHSKQPEKDDGNADYDPQQNHRVPLHEPDLRGSAKCSFKRFGVIRV
jgi:hypothetical protein